MWNKVCKWCCPFLFWFRNHIASVTCSSWYFQRLWRKNYSNARQPTNTRRLPNNCYYYHMLSFGEPAALVDSLHALRSTFWSICTTLYTIDSSTYSRPITSRGSFHNHSRPQQYFRFLLFCAFLLCLFNAESITQLLNTYPVISWNRLCRQRTLAMSQRRPRTWVFRADTSRFRHQLPSLHIRYSYYDFLFISYLSFLTNIHLNC